MKNKGKFTTKGLLITLAILAVIAAALGIWRYFGSIKFIPTHVENNTPIKVSDLKDGNEKTLGTIIYPGAKETAELQPTADGNKINLETTDSLSGVINIYSQDLANRYPDYSLTKKEIRKAESLSKKATVLTCSSPNGKLIITAFPNKNGLTSIEIEKTNTF